MNIYESISAIMEDVPAIDKADKNQTQGYRYRGVDTVMNFLKPLLAKHHVFVVPEVLEQTREERVNSRGTVLIYSILKTRYTFFAEDGTSVSATVIGEGMDSGDKASNKALSVGFKYAMFQVFCIPTEDMVDPDAESPEPLPKEPAPKPAPKAEPKPAPKAEKAPEKTPADAPKDAPKHLCEVCGKGLYTSADARIERDANDPRVFHYFCKDCK